MPISDTFCVCACARARRTESDRESEAGGRRRVPLAVLALAVIWADAGAGVAVAGTHVRTQGPVRDAVGDGAHRRAFAREVLELVEQQLVDRLH
jgi:hypothetical protein